MGDAPGESHQASEIFGWGGGSTPKSPLPLGGQGPHLIQCVIGPRKCSCQVACKSVERFKEGARV